MTILYFGIGWLLGLWLSSLVPPGPFLWLIAGGAGLIGWIASRKTGKGVPVSVIVCAVGLGGARYQAARVPLDSSQVAYYNNRQDVTLTGIVDEAPDIRDSYVNLTLAVDFVSLEDGSPQAVTGLVLVRAPRFPVVEYGARVQATGYLEDPPMVEQFDYREYLARKGIHSILSSTRLLVVAENEGSPLKSAILRFKRRAQASLDRSIPEPQAALLSGILLGEDKRLSPDLRQAFQVTGLTHIIAISGFNIAILVGVLMRLSRSVLPRRGALLFSLGGVLVYTILVGLDASVVRAAIMGSIYLVTLHGMGRTHFPYAALFLAATLMTFFDPFTLWDIGFQLSFAATMGLMLYTGPLTIWARARMEKVLDESGANRLVRLVSESILITIAAQILTMPLFMSYFGRISLISLPANAAIIPAQPGVMVLGGLATLAGLISPSGGRILGWLAWPFLGYTTELARVFSRVPGATAAFELSTGGVVLIYLVIAAMTWLGLMGQERRKTFFARLRPRLPQRLVLAAIMLIAVLVFAWGLTQPDGRLHVAFVDVGQGDAIFIQTPSGRQILVDGGGYPTVLNDALGRQMPFWDKVIDIMVASHPDGDHVSGLPDVLNRYRVRQLITDGEPPGASEPYDELLARAEEERVEIHAALAGETIEISDGVRMEMLHPGPGQPSENGNDNSVSFRLVYGEFALLLTGDAEVMAERAMLANSLGEGGRPLFSQVFKAGHHGSSSSSNSFFLEAVRPQIIVVSAGKDNSFGHPHPELLERARAVGAAVLRTDELGTIELVTDGQQMWWQAEKKNQESVLFKGHTQRSHGLDRGTQSTFHESRIRYTFANGLRQDTD